MEYKNPYAFFLLIVIPLHFLLKNFFFKHSKLKYSSFALLKNTGLSLKQKFMLILDPVLYAGLILLIIAIAGPRKGLEEIKQINKGIAIMIVVDRSSSMNQPISYRGFKTTRFEAVKKVMLNFIFGEDGKLEGRKNDLIGLISFARYADTMGPLTKDHEIFNQFEKTLKTVDIKQEDGTAIGDALALACARLKNAENIINQNKDSNYQIKSRIIILLTDGENNFGENTPEDAAQIAKKFGIKIYSLGIGEKESYITMNTPFGIQKIPVNRGMDTKLLQEISAATGGFFNFAENAQDIEKFYQEIDKLEKSEIESMEYMKYNEYFENFAAASLWMILLYFILSYTIFRRTP